MVVVVDVVGVVEAGREEVDLGRSQDGRKAETRCIVNCKHPSSSTSAGEGDQRRAATVGSVWI